MHQWEHFQPGGLSYVALVKAAVSFQLLQRNVPKGPKRHHSSQSETPGQLSSLTFPLQASFHCFVIVVPLFLLLYCHWFTTTMFPASFTLEDFTIFVLTHIL